ncbi:MAG: TonB-dependent receptor plug domain-containing protein [Longimicrobiales bacterium]
MTSLSSPGSMCSLCWPSVRVQWWVLTVATAGLLFGAIPSGLVAQSGDEGPPTGRASPEPSTDSLRFRVDGLTVTATRSARPVFLTPAPAATLGREQIFRRLATTPTDVLETTPGVDISGVGERQARPVIRGFRGQRILLMADGIRLNNSRRQQDFGELPALVAPPSVERVELVKGPASVLYGTDAIGGVVNLVTRRPQAEGVEGALGMRFGSAQDAWAGNAHVRGTSGAWDFEAAGDRSTAEAYSAPAGSFGSISLDEAVRVQGTASEQWSLRGEGGVEVAPGHRFFVGGSFTDAGESGFGFVDPVAYAPDLPLIEITYPDQRYSRLSAGYEGAQLESVLADVLAVRLYRQRNERDLTFSMTQALAPGAMLAVQTQNFTDIRTNGFRVEAKKLVGEELLFTYGVDGFQDRSRNTDVSMSLVTGFGPPQAETDSTPQIPNATFNSVGLFAQSEVGIGDLTVVLGARGQRVGASTDATPGLALETAERSQWTMVRAANLLYRVTDEVALVGSVGRGFRAPNLVELFFEGPVPEAGAFQARNLDLGAETSVSVDVGARIRVRRAAAEAFFFQSDLDGGIRAAPTGDSIQGLPVFQNTNLEALRYRGFEGSIEIQLGGGFSGGGGYTWLSSEDRLDPDNPVGDTFSRRLTGRFGFDDSAERFWGEFRVRRNGERKDVVLGANPLGPLLPAFTVMDLAVGTRLDVHSGFSPRLVLRLDNLTDQLYAEFPNAGFFRPAPGRRFSLGLEVGF